MPKLQDVRNNPLLVNDIDKKQRQGVKAIEMQMYRVEIQEWNHLPEIQILEEK
jgi:hypothetical protein